MQCQHAYELFSDYIAADIDRALLVSLENHLAGCRNCREEVDGLRRVWGALDELPSAEPQPFLHENIMSRLEAERIRVEEASQRKRAIWDWRLLFRPRALALASAIIVLVLTGAHVTQPAVGARFFDPLGWLLSVCRPAAQPVAPEFQSGRADWLAGPQGGGTLVVRLKAASDAHGSIAYECSLGGSRSVLLKGRMASSQETTVNVRLPELPAGSRFLTVTLSAADGVPGSSATTVRIPIVTGDVVTPASGDGSSGL